jgi:hypothetical protein
MVKQYIVEKKRNIHSPTPFIEKAQECDNLNDRKLNEDRLTPIEIYAGTIQQIYHEMGQTYYNEALLTNGKDIIECLMDPLE